VRPVRSVRFRRRNVAVARRRAHWESLPLGDALVHRSWLTMSFLLAALLPAWAGMGSWESHVPVRNAELYVREVGSGTAVIVLHGGPDFDHRYLLPDLDRLSEGYRPIYYDQRGRGGSTPRVKPEEVSLASEIADLDAVRQAFHLDRVVLLGHS
jgi:hypothetical protein